MEDPKPLRNIAGLPLILRESGRTQGSISSCWVLQAAWDHSVLSLTQPPWWGATHQHSLPNPNTSKPTAWRQQVELLWAALVTFMDKHKCQNDGPIILDVYCNKEL